MRLPLRDGLAHSKCAGQPGLAAATGPPPPSKNAPQVVSILAKPNYRHQKKQKEQARKLRQAEKQNRRMAARNEAVAAGGSNAAATPDGTAALPTGLDPTQAGT